VNNVFTREFLTAEEVGHFELSEDPDRQAPPVGRGATVVRTRSSTIGMGTRGPTTAGIWVDGIGLTNLESFTAKKLGEIRETGLNQRLNSNRKQRNISSIKKKENGV